MKLLYTVNNTLMKVVKPKKIIVFDNNTKIVSIIIEK